MGLPMLPILLHLVLPPFNALYYGKQAVANYSIHYITKLLAQDQAVRERMEELAVQPSLGLEGAKAMAWKEAMKGMMLAL